MNQDQVRNGGGIFWLFGQMFRLPVAAFVYTMEMLVKTMQELQRMADQGVHQGVSAPALVPQPPLVAMPAPAIGPLPAPVSEPGAQTSSQSQPAGAAQQSAETIHKETTKMPDTNLNDDMLKLVRYKVLFVKREYETAFKEREDLVSDNMSSSAFTAWKIAEFIQNIGDNELPGKWRSRNYPGRDYLNGAKLKGFPEEDKKYLRVYYEVLERYPREKFKYEEQQIEILRDISNKLDRGETKSSSSTTPAASTTPGKT